MNPPPPQFDTIKEELLKAGKDNESTREIVEKFTLNEISHDTIWDSDLRLNLLHIAAWTGDLKTIEEQLLQNRADPAAKTAGGFRALHLAASRGHIDAVRELIRWVGVDVRGSTSDGQRKRRKPFVKEEITCISDEGFTPLHLAAYGGYLETVKLLLRVNGLNVNGKDKLFGRTALHFAAERGHEKVVRLLTSSAPLEVNSKDTVRGWTPFLLATVKPPEDGFSLHVVEMLLDVNGGQINDKVGTLTEQTTQNVTKFSGEVWRPLTPMEVDRSMKSTPGVTDEVDEKEMDRYRRFAVAIEGHTALHMAATQNNAELVRHLVNRTGVPLQLNERDIAFGMTPLHCAVRTGAMEAFRALMAIDGIDVNATSAEKAELQRPSWLPQELFEPEDFDELVSKSHQFDTPLHLAVRVCSAEDLSKMVPEFCNHPNVNAAILNGVNLCALELAWIRLLFCPRPPSIFEVRKEVSENPVEKYEYNDRVYLTSAVDALESHPSNAPIISAAAETKKAVQDSVNAVLVTATLLAGLTFGAYLQPPIGSDVGDYRMKPAKLFWLFNGLSFYFAVYTILRALLQIMRSDQRLDRAFHKYAYMTYIRIQTAVPLTLSVGFGIGAFVAAGFGNLPSGGKFRNVMVACSSGGLLLVLGQLVRNLYLVVTFVTTSRATGCNFVFSLSDYGYVVSRILLGPFFYPVAYGVRVWALHSGRTVSATSTYGDDMWTNVMFLGVQMWVAVAVVVYSVTQV